MAKKPSKPRLKRHFMYQLALGPYLGTERKRYGLWYADLGQDRVVTTVQMVRDPQHLGNEKKNPVLYRNVLDASEFHESMDIHKWILISGGNAIYHAIEPELRRISRPMVQLCGEDACWQTFEVGHGTETLQVWREEILRMLANGYQIKDWTETLVWLKELYRDVLTEETCGAQR
jgi:hypothetical protein